MFQFRMGRNLNRSFGSSNWRWCAPEKGIWGKRNPIYFPGEREKIKMMKEYEGCERNNNKTRGELGLACFNEIGPRDLNWVDERTRGRAGTRD